MNGYRRIVGENLTNCGGVTCDGLPSRPGEVEILLAASCYRNRDKLRQLWASWLQGFTLHNGCARALYMIIVLSYLISIQYNLNLNSAQKVQV